MLLLVLAITVALLQVQSAPIDSLDDQPEYLRRIEELSQQCSSELKINAKLPSMLGGQFPEDNKDLNALFGCVWAKLGIVDNTSVVEVDKLKEYLTSVSTMFIPSVIKNCKDVEAKDFGQKTVKIQNCMMLFNIKLVRKYYSK